MGQDASRGGMTSSYGEAPKSLWDFSASNIGNAIVESYRGGGDASLVEHYREMRDNLRDVICSSIPSSDFIGIHDQDMFKYACHEEMDARSDAVQAKNAVEKAVKQKQSENQIEHLRNNLRLAENRYKQAEALSYSSSLCILDRLMTDNFVGNGSLDEILAPYIILNEATPEKLAAFSRNGSDLNRKRLVDEMLDNIPLMTEMILAGGAKNGNYCEALSILDNIMSSSSILSNSKISEIHPILKRLALGTSLEHAVGIYIFDTNEVINPVERYLHYEKAYLNHELDPCLDSMTTWECRWITNSDARDDQTSWCRRMLRNYRPDQVIMKDYSWRYCQIVRSEVRYKNPEWKCRPKTYQDLISGGGKW